MKKTAITLIGVIIAVIVLHAFKTSQTSTVTGHIASEGGITSIIARQGTDSVQAEIAPGGLFRINLKRGKWQLEMKKVDSLRQISKVFLDSITISKPADINLGQLSP
jgi:hypothetical protein